VSAWWVVAAVVAVWILALPLAVAVGRAFKAGWREDD
jgi:hypothetical protein